MALRAALPQLPAGFPPVRAMSLGKLSTEEHLAAALNCPGHAEPVIVARILGGLQRVPGFRHLADSARARGQHLVIVNGTGIPDPELAAASTVSPSRTSILTPTTCASSRLTRCRWKEKPQRSS